MHDILRDLVQTLSARAALTVAKDGMLVACHAAEGLDPERLGALGTGILRELTSALAAEGWDHCRQIEVAADRGRLVVVDAGPMYLLVLVGARLEIGADSIDIQRAAQRIVKESGLTSA